MGQDGDLSLRAGFGQAAHPRGHQQTLWLTHPDSVCLRTLPTRNSRMPPTNNGVAQPLPANGIPQVHSTSPTAPPFQEAEIGAVTIPLPQ